MDIVTLALAKNAVAGVQSQVDTLKNIGRFLSIWNPLTGLPSTNPGTLPYSYKTGDYYRVGAIANYKHTISLVTSDYDVTISMIIYSSNPNELEFEDITSWLVSEGYYDNGYPTTDKMYPVTSNKPYYDENIIGVTATNQSTLSTMKLRSSLTFGYTISESGLESISDTVTSVSLYKPTGSSYTGAASTTVETESINVGSVYYYDGTSWMLQTSGSGGIVDALNELPGYDEDEVQFLKNNSGTTRWSNYTHITDIQINDSSILDEDTGIANITDDDLEDVKYTAQSLTAEEKTQARTNIGAVALAEYNSSASSYAENTLYYVVEN